MNIMYFEETPDYPEPVQEETPATQEDLEDYSAPDEGNLPSTPPNSEPQKN